MKFIDELVNGYQYSKAVSSFIDKSRKEGVNLRRLERYPQVQQEYETLLERANDLSHLSTFGHMAYVISHPRRYLGKENDYTVTEQIFLNEKEEKEKKWDDLLRRIEASTNQTNWPPLGDC